MNNKKLINILIVFGVLFFTLATYLMMIEVVFKDDYIEKDKSRAIFKERTVLRGSIYDRNGETLSYSQFEGDVQKRYYPYLNMYSHVIGYNLDAGNKSRIEKNFNTYLYGDSMMSGILNMAEKYIEGKKIGNNLTLTIDHRLQKKAYELLGNRKGAVVVSNPKTGEIYALVSKPDFDPSSESLNKNWEKLSTDDKNSPFLTRATQGLYPPGSTYKIVTAAALIESGNGDFKVFDDGEKEIGGTVVKNSGDKNPNKELDLKEAFKISSNVYFVTAGAEVLKNNLTKEFAEKFLIGKEIDFDIDVSKSIFSDDLTITESAMSAMGQGQHQLLTPLNINLITSAIANGGKIQKPYIVQSVNAQNGAPIEKFGSQIIATPIKKETADILKDFMKAVVNEDGGTGHGARWGFTFNDITICGKTGTAETKDAKDHALFTGFAPYEDPEIVVTVIIENGGFGGSVAAPVAGNILNEYFKNKQ